MGECAQLAQFDEELYKVTGVFSQTSSALCVLFSWLTCIYDFRSEFLCKVGVHPFVSGFAEIATQQDPHSSL